MRTVFSGILQAVKRIEKDFDELILDEVKEKETEIIEINTDEQLFRGLTSRGQNIRPKYSPSTIERKKRKRQPYDRVTLKDEGDFHRSFFIRYSRDSFEIDSKDEKRKYLEKRYEDIYGLTDDSITKMNELIKYGLIETIRKQILN